MPRTSPTNGLSGGSVMSVPPPNSCASCSTNGPTHPEPESGVLGCECGHEAAEVFQHVGDLVLGTGQHGAHDRRGGLVGRAAHGQIHLALHEFAVNAV